MPKEQRGTKLPICVVLVVLTFTKRVPYSVVAVIIHLAWVSRGSTPGPSRECWRFRQIWEECSPPSSPLFGLTGCQGWSRGACLVPTRSMPPAETSTVTSWSEGGTILHVWHKLFRDPRVTEENHPELTDPPSPGSACYIAYFSSMSSLPRAHNLAMLASLAVTWGLNENVLGACHKFCRRSACGGSGPSRTRTRARSQERHYLQDAHPWSIRLGY